jgi:hypothetical protein
LLEPEPKFVGLAPAPGTYVNSYKMLQKALNFSTKNWKLSFFVAIYRYFKEPFDDHFRVSKAGNSFETMNIFDFFLKFMGTVVGAGAKIFAKLEPEPKFLTSWSRSRTKMDRLRNTDEQ